MPKRSSSRSRSRSHRSRSRSRRSRSRSRRSRSRSRSRSRRSRSRSRSRRSNSPRSRSHRSRYPRSNSPSRPRSRRYRRYRRCSSGKIHRMAYTRKDGVYVKAGCVKDKGERGKTPKSKRVLPKLVPGRLTKYGYSTSKSTSTRHAALHDAIRAEGYASIVRRLVAVSNYNKKTAPEAHDVMRSDIKWAQEKMKPIYGK